MTGTTSAVRIPVILIIHSRQNWNGHVPLPRQNNKLEALGGCLNPLAAFTFTSTSKQGHFGPECYTENPVGWSDVGEPDCRGFPS
jgi:hypothetical protein